MAETRNLRNHQGMPIQFVNQAELAPKMAYEAYISATGRVPTRENLHDFLNALVWLTYPRSKARLNAIQAAEIVRREQSGHVGDPGSTTETRGVTRDRATIFDENAAILLTCDDHIQPLLVRHAWEEALWRQRSAFGAAWEVQLFGHALIEKLVTPYKAITAHVWMLRVESGFFDVPASEKYRVVDNLLDQGLRQALLAGPGTPLPILGVPGWWVGQDASFYRDTAVFRPPRCL